MSASRKRLLLILLGVAILMWILGAALTPVIDNLDPKVKADNVIINGVPFILVFIGIVIVFIDFIILVASLLNNNISEKMYRPIERVLIAGIVLGVIGMFQPFTVVLYTWGFILLLISIISYIAWSHIVPRTHLDRAARHDGGLGSVSIGEIEQHRMEG
jgi:hypothetical protein